MKTLIIFFILITSCIAKEYQYITPIEIKFGDFEEISKIILNAKEGDVIIIHVQTFGGSVAEGIKLLTAFENTKAKIITKGHYIVASMGYLILLNGHEIYIDDNAKLMTHLCVDSSGKMLTDPISTYFNEILILNNLDLRFILNSDETDMLLSGQMLWFDGDAFKRKLLNSQSSLRERLHK